MNSYNSTHTGQQLDRAIDFMLSHEDIIRLSKEEIIALVQAKIEELRSITDADAIGYTVDETVKDALDRVIKDGMKSIELKPRTDGKQGFVLVVENLNGRKTNSGFEIDNYASNIRFDGTLAGIPEDNVEGAINRLATNVNKNKDDLSELSLKVYSVPFGSCTESGMYFIDKLKNIFMQYDAKGFDVAKLSDHLSMLIKEIFNDEIKIEQSVEGGWFATDKLKNVIFKYDAKGFDVAKLSDHLSMLIKEIFNDEIKIEQSVEGGWFATDKLKNVIFKYDAKGFDVAKLSDHFLELVGKEKPNNLEYLRSDRLLVWHDEFDKKEVDETKWSNQYGISDSNTFYTKEIKKNAICNDGVLKYSMINDGRNPTNPRSSIFLHTNRKFEFRYGLVEARIKFPTNSIYHSTLWTLGANLEYTCGETENDKYSRDKGVLFQTCGEIDIAECDNRNVTCNFHWSSDTNNTPAHRSGASLVNPASSNDWHIYGCEWTETYIKIYVDRVLKYTFEHSVAQVGDYNPYKLPHHLILNCIPQLNGQADWEECTTQVDWVRVYAPQGITEIIKESSITFDKSSIELSVGDKELLTASFTPGNTSDMTLQWLSMNTNVAEIYGGMVHAKSVGYTYVKAISKNGCVAKCKIIINK